MTRLTLILVILAALAVSTTLAQGFNPSPTPTLNSPISESYDPLSPETVSLTTPGNMHVVGSTITSWQSAAPGGTPRYTPTDLGIPLLLPSGATLTNPANVDAFTNFTDVYPIYGITQNEIVDWATSSSPETADVSIEFTVARDTATEIDTVAVATYGGVWDPADLVDNHIAIRDQAGPNGNGAASDTFIAQVTATARYSLVHASDAYAVTPRQPNGDETDIDALYEGETPLYPVAWSLDGATGADLEVTVAGFTRTVSGADVFVTPSQGAAPLLYAEYADLGLLLDDNVDAICIHGDRVVSDGLELVFSVDNATVARHIEIKQTAGQTSAAGELIVEFGAGALYLWTPASGVTLWAFSENLGVPRPATFDEVTDPCDLADAGGDINGARAFDPPKFGTGTVFGLEPGGHANPMILTAIPGHENEWAVTTIDGSAGGRDRVLYLRDEPVLIEHSLFRPIQAGSHYTSQLRIVLLIRAGWLSQTNLETWPFYSSQIYVATSAMYPQNPYPGDASELINWETGLDLTNGIPATGTPNTALETPHTGWIFNAAPGTIGRFIVQPILFLKDVGQSTSQLGYPVHSNGYYFAGNAIDLRFGYDVVAP